MKYTLVPPEAIPARLSTIPGWEVRDGRLFRRWKFADFAEALAFANRVGALAEAANHHPDLKIGWGYAEIELHTHDIGGLSGADFDLAAKI